ncbi:MAG: hypothetical protein KDA95_00730 [Acidimicrobiales bacterium]|nr:hypothetical protein [Acidimicrobiales bacterium]
MSVVLTPSTRSQRSRLAQLGLMIFVASLPIAAILAALVTWAAAGVFVVVWTVGLLLGASQQRISSLKVDDNGMQYEAGNFVLRATWADIERIERADLPAGPTEAFVLNRGRLRWAKSAEARAQVTQRGWDKLIPIDEFAPQWPKGRLADEVRAHRPDLLKQLKSD